MNKLVTVREERISAVAPPPLPMRAERDAPAHGSVPSHLTRHQRIMRVATPRRQVAAPRPRGPSAVTGAQQRRARQLERLTQRMLAEKRGCSRAAIAEAERSVDGREVRAVLPNVAEWVEDILRVHGEWAA